MISRRDLIACLALAPVVPWAQPAPGMHRIGTLSGRQSPKTKGDPLWPVFFENMRKLGYEEGRNVVYEFRYAEGVPARFPELARQLVASGVNVIVFTGSSEAVALSKATSTIPLVGIHVGDPVGLGLAASLARPSRNLTGSTLYIPGFAAKSLEQLIEAFPGAKRIGVLANPTQPNYPDDRRDLERVANSKSITLLPTVEATRPEELDAALERIAAEKPQALMVLNHALFIFQRKRVIEFLARAKVPAMHGYVEDVEAGGLMAYAVETRSLYGRAPVFVDKILKGANPADLPIEQPTKFEFVINLKTAKALGLTIPPAVLARADEVIQ